MNENEQAELLKSALDEAGIEHGDAAMCVPLRIAFSQWMDGDLTRDDFVQKCKAAKFAIALSKAGLLG
jgi:hypothetical protein